MSDPSGCILESGYDSISDKFFFKKSTWVDCSDNICSLDFRLPDENRDIKLNLGWILGFRKEFYCCNDYVLEEDVWTQSKTGCWPCKQYNTDISLNSLEVWGDNQPYGFISEGNLDLAGPKYLFIIVNDYNNNVHNKYTSISYGSVNISSSNILAKIPMSYSKNVVGFNNNSDMIPKSREYFGPVTIEKLHIKIIDDMGRIVDFNNNDISLLLDFDCVYNL